MSNIKKNRMMKIGEFILTLFLGQEKTRPKKKPRPAFKNQVLNVKRIWTNEHYNDFGIERLIRLTLAVLLFIFPGLYIRDIFGRFGLLSRKIGVEVYVILKLFLPIIFFELHWTTNVFVAIISGYLAIETVIYLASLIFLSNEFTNPISYKRSLVTLFINYIEICLNYAVIYWYCNFAIPNFFNEKLTDGIQAVYFSFVTSATVGYGDIFPKTAFGQYMVISQIIIFLIFIALFLNSVVSKIQDKTDFNSKPTYNDKLQNQQSNNQKK
jgi:hypothetical protein